MSNGSHQSMTELHSWNDLVALVSTCSNGWESTDRTQQKSLIISREPTSMEKKSLKTMFYVPPNRAPTCPVVDSWTNNPPRYCTKSSSFYPPSVNNYASWYPVMVAHVLYILISFYLPVPYDQHELVTKSSEHLLLSLQTLSLLSRFITRQFSSIASICSILLL